MNRSKDREARDGVLYARAQKYLLPMKHEGVAWGMSSEEQRGMDDLRTWKARKAVTSSELLQENSAWFCGGPVQGAQMESRRSVRKEASTEAQPSVRAE